MEHASSPFLLAARIGLLAVFGFAVIVLIGPAVAILATLLPFVLVGAIAWCLVQLLVHGPQAAWRRLGEAGRLVVASAGRVGHAVTRLAQGTRSLAVRAWRGSAAGAKLAAEWGAVALCGAGIGLAVGLVTGWQNHDREVAVPLNVVLGGLMASGVWAGMTLLGRKKVPVVEVASRLPQRG